MELGFDSTTPLPIRKIILGSTSFLFYRLDHACRPVALWGPGL